MPPTEVRRTPGDDPDGEEPRVIKRVRTIDRLNAEALNAQTARLELVDDPIACSSSPMAPPPKRLPSRQQGTLAESSRRPSAAGASLSNPIDIYDLTGDDYVDSVGKTTLEDIRAIRAESDRFFQSQRDEGIEDEGPQDLMLEELEAAESQLKEAAEVSRRPDPDPIPSTCPEEVCTTLEEYALRLRKAYDDDIQIFIQEALEVVGYPCDDWVKRRKDSRTLKYHRLEIMFLELLASVHKLILKHIIMGDLPRACSENVGLMRHLDSLKPTDRKADCPSVYIFYLVNNSGHSPTPRELMKILDTAEEYVEGYHEETNAASWALAEQIDVLFGSSSTPKYRLMNKGRRRYIDSYHRRNVCVRWIAATRARLRGHADDGEMDKPLERPLCEVGYATNPLERLQQHEAHESPNYLMNLTHAICVLKFQQYSMVPFVVLHMFNPTHAMLGEIIISRASHCYVTYGGGFSHHSAGISHMGAVNTDSKYYRAKRAAVVGSDIWTGNMAAATKVLEAML